MKFDKKAVEEGIKYTLLICLGISFIYVFFFIALVEINMPKRNNLYLVLPFIVFLTPYLTFSLFQKRKVEAKMAVVPRFLRDVVDNVESGMDLVSSIKVTTGNEYGVLNDEIRKLSNQLQWGIDFEVAFLNFARNVGSTDLIRDFRLVIEARKIGGHVEKILRELSEKINIDILRKKERKSNLSSNTFTGYISFLIFLIIIVLVYNNLFVGLSDAIGGDDTSGLTEEELAELEAEAGIEDNGEPVGPTAIYLSLLMFLSYELSIFSGMLFGLMQEGDIIAGAPHIIVLVILTFLGFQFFIQ